MKRTKRQQQKIMNRILTVTKKEFIHIKRDKPSLIISFLNSSSFELRSAFDMERRSFAFILLF